MTESTPTATSVPASLRADAVVGPERLTDIVFVDAAHGFALTGDPLQLAATSDAGDTWRVVGDTLPLTAGAGDASPHVLFQDRQLGFVYGRGVLVTRDGGHTWIRADVGHPQNPQHAYVAALMAVDSTVWAVLTCAPDSGPCLDYLAVSNDDGATWEVRDEPPMLNGPDVMLSRVGRDSGFVHALGHAANGLYDRIAVTRDGGASWTYRPDPCALDEVERLVALSSTNLWLFCGGEPGAGNQLKTVRRSTDGGAHWQTVSGTEPNNSASHAIPGSGYLTDTAVLSDSTAWVAFARGSGYVTRDGGHTWTPAFAADPDAGVTRITFIDAAHGWALNYPALWRTTDGHHWRRIGPPHP
jgi:photosystem II stability/assembly factor-like uncharacterized protein